MAKDNQILIKLSEPEKIDFKRAAKLTGVGFSAWARQILRMEAIKEFEKVGEKPVFLETIRKQ